MSDIVDQVLADAAISDPAPKQDQAPAAKETATEAEKVEPQEADNSEADVPFPKKAINALSRRDKQIGKLRAQEQYLRQELAKYQEQAQKPKSGNSPEAYDGPVEDDFETYGEFIKAVAKHEARKELAQGAEQNQKSQQSAQIDAWKSEREQFVADKANELIAENPEYQDLVLENADLLDSFPEHLEHAFLEADNGALAFVVLAKEGKLESLMSMSPAKAIMEIGRAQDRGINQAKPKQISKAPPIISSAKGNSPVGKSLDNMSGEEMMKKLNIKF